MFRCHFLVTARLQSLEDHGSSRPEAGCHPMGQTERNRGPDRTVPAQRGGVETCLADGGLRAGMRGPYSR